LPRNARRQKQKQIPRASALVITAGHNLPHRGFVAPGFSPASSIHTEQLAPSSRKPRPPSLSFRAERRDAVLPKIAPLRFSVATRSRRISPANLSVAFPFPFDARAIRTALKQKQIPRASALVMTAGRNLPPVVA